MTIDSNSDVIQHDRVWIYMDPNSHMKNDDGWKKLWFPWEKASTFENLIGIFRFYGLSDIMKRSIFTWNGLKIQLPHIFDKLHPTWNTCRSGPLCQILTKQKPILSFFDALDLIVRSSKPQNTPNFFNTKYSPCI